MYINNLLKKQNLQRMDLLQKIIYFKTILIYNLINEYSPKSKPFDLNSWLWNIAWLIVCTL